MIYEDDLIVANAKKVSQSVDGNGGFDDDGSGFDFVFVCAFFIIL